MPCHALPRLALPRCSPNEQKNSLSDKFLLFADGVPDVPESRLQVSAAADVALEEIHPAAADFRVVPGLDVEALLDRSHLDFVPWHVGHPFALNDAIFFIAVSCETGYHNLHYFAR
jgi:hypothetical protein